MIPTIGSVLFLLFISGLIIIFIRWAIKPRWESIGTIGFNGVKGDVPHWVRSAIEQIKDKHGGTSSSFLNKTFFIKGNHYRYRILFEGQGGSLVIIQRRKRAKGALVDWRKE